MSNTGGGRAGTGGRGGTTATLVAPTGLGWPNQWAFAATLTEQAGTMRPRATVGLSPAAAFDAVSTARTAPGATYYVDVTASNGDSTGDGSSGNPYRSIWKAISVANAGGVPAKIVVKATGSYGRFFNPSYNNGSSNLWPTVDTAILASGGKVLTGVFETTITASRDGTNVNTFTATVTTNTIDRVLDRTRLDRFGNAVELQNVGSAALCNAVPDSWYSAAGNVLYVNRRDQQTPTAANTRILRASTQCFWFSALVNVYVGGETANDGWECVGGALGGPVYGSWSGTDAGGHVIAMEHVASTHGGGIVSTAGRAFSFDNFSGLVSLSDCRGDGGWTDGFNFHASSGGTMYALTVNCEGSDNGRVGQVSCNGWTSHETVVGIDLAGHYRESHGGACRSINSSKSWLAGTFVEDDRGDLGQGGSVPATAFRVDDTAVYWLDRTRIALPVGGYAHVASGGSSAIHKRNVIQSPHAELAVGTIDSW